MTLLDIPPLPRPNPLRRAESVRAVLVPRPNPRRAAASIPPPPAGFDLVADTDIPPPPPGFELVAEEAPAGTYLGEIGKGIARGATGMAGTAVSGAAALDPTEAYARDIASYREDLLRVPEMTDADMAVFQKRIDAEPSAITRRIIRRTIADIREGRVTLDEIAATPEPTPMAERPLFEAGREITEAGREAFPAAKGWEDSITAMLSEGVGSFVAGLGAAAVTGGAGAGVAFTAAGIGEAAERAVQFDEQLKAQGKPGLSEEQIALASLYGVAPGATDIIPVEFVLGRLNVPTPFRRPLAQAIGRIGGQAFIEGVQEGGQQFWQNLISREVYNPEQDLGEGVPGGAGVGVGVGGIVGTGKELLTETARLASGRRGRAPGVVQRSAESVPPPPEGFVLEEDTGLPEGAQPAEALYPEPVAEPAPEAPVEAPEVIAPAPAVTAETPPPPEGFVQHGKREAPVTVETPEDLEVASATAAAEPTDGQKEAGNYQKAHVKLQGLDITIENPKGSVRRGRAADGSEWSVKMPAAYGYIRGVSARSRDKEHVDVYVGDNLKAGLVFIVNQINPSTGRFDEAKIILGASDAATAVDLYDEAFSDGSGPRRRDSVIQLPVAKLKGLLNEHDFSNPVGPSAVNQRVALELPSRDGAPTGVPRLEGDEDALPESEQHRVQGLRRQGGSDLPGVDGRLRGVLSGDGAEANGEAQTRKRGQRKGLRADKLRVGDDKGAKPKQKVEPASDLSRQKEAADDVGGRVGAVAQRDKSQAEEGVVSGESTGDTSRDGTKNARTLATADAGRVDAANKGVGKEARDISESDQVSAGAGAVVESGASVGESTSKGARRKVRPPQSLTDFLASIGGLKDFKGELRAIGLDKKFIPGKGRLVRKKGRTLDYARERAAEAGYFDHLYGTRDRAAAESTPADLLNLLDRENNRGERFIPPEDRAEAEEAEIARQNRDARDRAREMVDREMYAASIEDDEVAELATEILLESGVGADEAIERATIRLVQDALPAQNQIEVNDDARDIPFFDDVPAQEPERVAERGGQPEPAGEGRREDESRDGEDAEDRREAVPRRGPDEGAEGAGGGEPRRLASVEPGADGRPQGVLSGAERISDAELAQRRADQPLRPKAPQRSADEGLFSDERDQTDLVDMARRASLAREDQGPPEGGPSRLASIAPEEREAARQEAWQKHARRIIDGTATADATVLPESAVLAAAAGVKGPITLPVRIARAVRQKHRDIPDRVWLDLRRLIADPLFVLTRRDETLSVVLIARTDTGLPVIVGMRGGEIRTVTPIHAFEERSGGERLAERVQEALRRPGIVYARSREALDRVISLTGNVSRAGRPYGTALPGQGTRARIITRADVFKTETARAAETSTALDEAVRIGLEDQERLSRAVRAIIRRVAGPDIGIQWHSMIPVPEVLGGAALERSTSARTSAGFTPPKTAGGFYSYPDGSEMPADALIGVALNDPLYDPLTTAGHEAWHHVESALLRDRERAVIAGTENMERVRLIVAEEYDLPLDSPFLVNEPDYELRAVAFQRYRRAREENRRTMLPADMRRIFDRLILLFKEIKALLTRRGLTKIEDIFEKARLGGHAGREARNVNLAEEEARRQSLASVASHDQLDPFAEGGAEARQRAMRHGIEFQPVDRAIRIPFDVFGGLNEKGEWKPGLYLSKQASRIITTARFADNSRFAWLNPVLHRARAGLVDRYGLDAAYVARERQRALDERGILAEVPEIMQAMAREGIGAQEARVLHDILVGEDVAEVDMARLSEPIRNAIDQFGAEAVELGLVTAESFERNRGKYLHRVYLKHETDQSGLAQWVGRMMSTRRKKIIGDELKGRGLFKLVDAEDLPFEGNTPPANGTKFILFDRMSDDGLKVEKREFRRFGAHAPEGEGWVSRGAWEVRGRSRGKIVMWRDYTKEERVRMGEITDARYTVAKTYMMMAHDLSVGRFYRDIARNADWATSTEPRESWKEAGDYSRFWADPSVEWVRVPDTTIPKSGTKRYGLLAGRWVRAEIWRDINELEKLNSENLWSTLLTEWKKMKTGRSPVVHMNNVMSNLVLMDMSGVGVSDLVSGIRSLVGKDDLYREAEAHGAFGADMASQEIRRNILQPLLEEIERGVQGGQGTLEARLGVLGKLADAIWSAAKFADRKMLDLYRLEDEVFRMALYARRRAQGIEAQEAADETREQFIDYDIRAPWINAARRSVLPFLSYSYRAVPLVARTVMTRPWKIAKYFAIMYGLNALSYFLLPGDEDEERRSMREEEQGFTWVGAPRMVRLPFADEHGNPYFLDIRRWIPAGDVFDIAQGSSAIGIPAPLNFGGPLMMGAELVLNKQAFTGKEIVNKLTDDWWDRTAKVGDWAWKSSMPSAAWVPGSWYWTKIGNAISGARDWQGRPYNVPAAVASSLGIKVSPRDVQEGFRIWGIEFDKVEAALKSERKRLGRDHARGLISREEYERQFAKYQEKLQRLAEKRRKTFTGR